MKPDKWLSWGIGVLLVYMLLSCAVKYWKLEKENEGYKSFLANLVQYGTPDKWNAAAPCMEEKGLPQTIRLNSDWVLKWWPVWIRKLERSYKLSAS